MGLVNRSLAHLSAPASCAPSFWRFVAAAGAGSLAAAGAGMLAKRLSDPNAREIVVFGARVAAFWGVAGLAWYLLDRQSAA